MFGHPDAPDMGPIPDTVIFARPEPTSRVDVLQQHSHQLPNGLRINFSINRIVKTAVHGGQYGDQA